MNPPQFRLPQTAENVETDILDWGQLLQVIWRRWHVIAGVVALAIAFALLVTVNQTRLFTANALILIETQENQVIDLESVVAGLPADTSTIESQVEILRSQSLAQRVVRELELVSDPEFNPAIVEESFNILSWVDPRNWIALIINTIKGPAVETLDEAMAAERQFNRVVQNVQGRLDVQRRGLTYVIEIGFTSDDPQKAAQIANTFADLYIVDQLEARFDATRRANEWLRDRLEALREQVRLAETAAADFAAAHNLVSTGETTLTEQQITQINAQLVAARADLSAAQANYDRIRQIIRSGGDLEALNQFAESPTFARLREQLTTLRREEAELSGRYGDLHPELINAREELQEVRDQIAVEMNRTISSFGNEVELAENRVHSLEQSLTQAAQDQAAANQDMIQLRELRRTAESQRTLYEAFLSRFNETREQEDLQTSDARIIAGAVAPLGPSHPQPVLNLAFGGILGVLSGLGVALFMEWLDRGVRNREQVEGYLQIPQLAAVPLLKNSALRKTGAGTLPQDFILKKPLSGYAEAFRALKAGISLSNIDNKPKVVLVTSALPNEGKSTVAFSLARHAASTGTRTLLIDADLRHPQITAGLQGKREKFKGLIDILTGEASTKDVLLRDPLVDLYHIFGGSNVANPADLLESTRMREFLDAVRSQFDLIILDSAPVLPVVDSRVLSQLADTTIFTVRWNETSRDAAAEAVRLLKDFDARIAGAVLNMVDLDRQRRFGYGGGSEYYYGVYRKYYSE